MNFRTQLDPPAIFSTDAAVDNVTVYGSLKMARAALDDGATARLARIDADRDTAIYNLHVNARKDRAYLRAARKAALKVREADLKTEDTQTSSAPSDQAGTSARDLRPAEVPPAEVPTLCPQAEGAGTLPTEPRSEAVTIAEIGRQVRDGATGGRAA